MKVFIVAGDSENKIVKVREEEIISFCKEYGSKILLEGESVQEVLITLSEKLNNGELDAVLRR